MEEEFNYGRINQNILVNGEMISLMELENFYQLMEIII